MHYVNSVLKRYCYEELSVLFAKTNNPMKEISESYAAYHHLRNATERDNILIDDCYNLHIGDGSTARTGAMFTFLSKSKNISIDPNTNLDVLNRWKEKHNVQNFQFYKNIWQDKVEDIASDIVESRKKYLNLVLVHSHVRTIDLMNTFPTWRYCYCNPCCNPNDQVLTTQQIEKLGISVITCGKDSYILSEKKDVVVYKNDKMFNEE